MGCSQYVPVDGSVIKSPFLEGEQPLKVMHQGDVSFVSHRICETFGKRTEAELAVFKIGSQGILFPVKDIHEPIHDDDVAGLLHCTRIGQFLPKPNVKFLNPQSNEGLTRQAFYGLGAHRLDVVDKSKPGVPDTAAFMVDLMVMANFEVRPGFCKYGANAYFDEDQEPLAIRVANGDVIMKDDGVRWEEAKALWRSSLITFVTAVDHLFNNHFWVGGQCCRATVTGLPKKHPLRRAIHPFLTGTIQVNNLAGVSLTGENSIVEHMTAYTGEALNQIAAATYSKGDNWTPLPEYIKSKGPAFETLVEEGKLPFFEDGLDLWKLYRAFFDAVLREEKIDVETDTDVQKFWSLLLAYTEATCLPQTLSRDTLLDTLATFVFQVILSCWFN